MKNNSGGASKQCRLGVVGEVDPGRSVSSRSLDPIIDEPVAFDFNGASSESTAKFSERGAEGENLRLKDHGRAEPKYRKEEIVDYCRRADQVVFARVIHVGSEDDKFVYDLEYEVGGTVKRKNCIAESTLYNMQQCNAFEEESQARSINTGKPCRWRGGRHQKELQRGDHVWFRRGNGDSVAGVVESIDKREDMWKIMVKYVGLFKGRAEILRKEVDVLELQRMQHPRNTPSGKSVGLSASKHLSHLHTIADNADADRLIPDGEHNNTMLHAASRGGDSQLVQLLLCMRADPLRQNVRGETPLHKAVYHGHLHVVELLVDNIPESTTTEGIKQLRDKSCRINGESPLDVARHCLQREQNHQDRLNIFAKLFGREPEAQERASQVLCEKSNKRIVTFRTNFKHSTAVCDFIGERDARFDFSDKKLFEDVLKGIRKEEERLKRDGMLFDDWSYWRASFFRGDRRFGTARNLQLRPDAATMCQWLEQAAAQPSRKDALRRCAIRLYTVASFLFKATNFAMRDADSALKLHHLKPYGRLLNDSVRHFAKCRPWRHRAHRILPLHDAIESDGIWSSALENEYVNNAPTAGNKVGKTFCWSGFVSATGCVIQDDGSEKPTKLFEDLRKYGKPDKPCLLFLITHNDGYCPVDLKDLAAFGEADNELLYPAGQQFQIIENVGRRSRRDVATMLCIPFDEKLDAGCEVSIFILKPCSFDFGFYNPFEDDGHPEQIASFLKDKLACAEREQGGESVAVANILSNLGCVLEDQGHFDEAANCHKRSLQIQEMTLGQEHPRDQKVATLSNLGSVLKAQGNFDEAATNLKRALQIQEMTLGQEHPHVATTLSNLGCVLQEQGNFDEAANCHKRSLQIQEITLGQEHPRVATTLSNLGLVLLAQANFDEAAKFFTRALPIQEMTLGQEHPEVAATLSNFGSVLQAQGNFDEAAKFFTRALPIQEMTLGQEHPEVAKTLSNLGCVLRDQGNFDEAAKCLKRSLQIDEMTSGQEHPDSATRLSNLGSVLQDQGNFDEAAKFFTRALQIQEMSFGQEHPEVATTLSNFGSVLRDQGNFDEAAKCLKRSLQIDEMTLGQEHPRVATTLSNLGLVLQDQGNFDEAAKFFTRALQIQEMTFGQEHPEVAATLSNFGSVLQAQGHFDEAAKFFTRALQIQEMTLGQEHPRVATTLSNLGCVLQDQGNFDEAAKCLTRALQIQEMTLGQMHPRVLQIIVQLGMCVARSRQLR